VASGPAEAVRRDPTALDAYLGASEEALQVSGPLREAPVQPPGRAGP